MSRDAAGDGTAGLPGVEPTTVLAWLALVGVGAGLFYLRPMVTGLITSLR